MDCRRFTEKKERPTSNVSPSRRVEPTPRRARSEFSGRARSEFSGSALEFGVLNHKSQAPRQKNGGQANYKPVPAGP